MVRRLMLPAISVHIFCVSSANSDAQEKQKQPEPQEKKTLSSNSHTHQVNGRWGVSSPGSCTGEQVEYLDCKNDACPSPCTPQDCKFADWHDWSACTCEGLKERNRLVDVHNNECGKPCAGNTTETGSCPTKCLTPATDCKLSDWGSWGECTDGKLQTSRARQVKVPAVNGGTGCSGDTSETKPCPIDKPDSRPCEWANYSAWSACTCTCDGGQKTRDRHVTQAPRGDGDRCPMLAKTEMAACNTQPCGQPCHDGTWNKWGDWSECTAKCSGGTQWARRTRAEEANHCGQPALGEDSKSRPCNQESCNVAVDCEFSVWGQWSACSCTCEGVQHRNRQITKYGKGDGKWCMGALKQLQACNNYTTTKNCKSDDVKSVDCVLADWGVWSSCTKTCDGGQQQRSRGVVAESKYGGATCKDDLEETRGCQEKPCKVVASKDCKWNSWSDWGACDKCGGQRKRSRNIQQMPLHGGEPCRFDASEETEDCPRVCHAQQYCAWGDWTAKDGCSTSCGAGFIKRRRTLGPTKIDPTKLFEVSDSSTPSGQYHLQDVFVSFSVGGFVTFVMIFVGMRIVRVRRDEQYAAMDGVE